MERWLLAFCGTFGIALSSAARGDLEFERDVRPILADACFRCHGPDEAARKAGLRLDLRAGLFGGTRAGFESTDDPVRLARVVAPSHPVDSELFRRISSTDDDERMPPHSAQRQLTSAEVEALRLWIEQGAPWSGHWAFQPIRAHEPPTLKAGSECRNEIDRFVLAALEAQSVRPVPEASRRTLLRRVSLDLTGLPPTGAELARFLADPATFAYEAEVDRLLASLCAQRPGIEVTGRVATTPPFFDRATIAIAPLRLARGVQNKVLEALSMGLPVVATPQAAQGLGEVPMGVLRIARTPQATIAHITELWRDPARARSDGQAAASFVRAHWRWQNTYARLDALFAQLGVSPTIRH